MQPEGTRSDIGREDGVVRRGDVRLKVLLGEVAPTAGPAETNLELLADALRRHPEADLAVFPELFLTGYDPVAARTHAVAVDGPEVRRIRRLAAELSTAVILGYAERAGETLYDSMLLVEADGSLAGNHRKTHLFGGERAQFSAASVLDCIRVLGLSVAPLICYELEFPEIARRLAAQEADLLVGIAANMEPYALDHRVAVQARALENRTPLVYVNRTGSEGELRFVGQSCAVAADGSIVGQTQPGVGMRLVELRPGRYADEPVDYWRFRRPELY